MHQFTVTFLHCAKVYGAQQEKNAKGAHFLFLYIPIHTMLYLLKCMQMRKKGYLCLTNLWVFFNSISFSAKKCHSTKIKRITCSNYIFIVWVKLCHVSFVFLSHYCVAAWKKFIAWKLWLYCYFHGWARTLLPYILSKCIRRWDESCAVDVIIYDDDFCYRGLCYI